MTVFCNPLSGIKSPGVEIESFDDLGALVVAPLPMVDEPPESSISPAASTEHDRFITWLLGEIDFSKCWIAGSSALTLFKTGSFDGCRDIDLFFRDVESCNKFVDKLRSKPVCTYLGESGGGQSAITQGRVYGGNAYIWTAESKFYNFKHEINIIGFNFYKDAYACIENFDLTPAQFATDGKRFVTTKKALSDVENNLMSFVNPSKIEREDWATVSARINKYTDKGFKTNEDITLMILKNV